VIETSFLVYPVLEIQSTGTLELAPLAYTPLSNPQLATRLPGVESQTETSANVGAARQSNATPAK
jgi:hypothetical protein